MSSKIVRDIVLTITVNFYSASDMKRPLWFQMSKPIYHDATKINTTIENTILSLQFYNRVIPCNGYVASLSIKTARDVKYLVRLQNTIGETRKSFELYSGKLGFH